MRFVYDGADELLRVVPDLSASALSSTDFGSYSREQFFADMRRVTEYRANDELLQALVDGSFDTMLWLRSQGVRFIPLYGLQAFDVGGKFRFWGGLVLQSVGGGPGLVDTLFETAERSGIGALYCARAVSLLRGGSRVSGAKLERQDGTVIDISANAVVLATGGFEANAEWRARYLGKDWDLAKVRGTRYNTGDGIRMALELGARPYGHWSGCHAVAWDRNAPDTGDLRVGASYQKHSYPLGIMVNANGERFVDEGADFRNYTYARYGRAILEQPGQFAWQVFDGKISHLLRPEYRISGVTRVSANTIEGLATLLDVDNGTFVRTVEEFNQHVDTRAAFNPNVKDGRSTRGLPIPKLNWANKLEQPPFEAYGVTCGITFTFGGLQVNRQAQVLNQEGRPIGGLFAAGELVGGLYYFNYPGGSGLMGGAVFGRIAGEEAAHEAQGMGERAL